MRLPRLAPGTGPKLIRDLHIYGGLAMVLLAPKWTFIVVGMILCLLGILAPRLGRTP